VDGAAIKYEKWTDNTISLLPHHHQATGYEFKQWILKAATTKQDSGAGDMTAQKSRKTIYL
jgi:hypothetical protein